MGGGRFVKVVIVLVVVALVIAWLYRGWKANVAAQDADSKKTEKAEKAAAQAVQNSINRRR